MKKAALPALIILLQATAYAQDTTRTIVRDTTENQELDAIHISSTRSSRSIRDIPTRIELIAGEELDEKANMKPGDIRMLLSESTGIQTQQTSATSADASIRIQGLDARYTQILRDGFPVYSGAASGLGLLQTPPLDLKQVEVIKGSSSTLYGGGAIAGLVNLISKTPTDEHDSRLLMNATSAKGFDLSGFYSKRFRGWGTTLFAARNSNEAYDPSGTGLTAIPKFTRYTFNPKLFLYPSKSTTVILGLNTTLEKRLGGYLPYIKSDTDTGYYERNDTKRISATLAALHKLSGANTISLKSSYSFYNRTIDIPGYVFDGTQHSTYTELTYNHDGKQLDWIAGGNVLTDIFREQQLTYTPRRDYTQSTIGLFGQVNWHAAEKLFVEAGLRVDRVIEYGFAVLPRASVLYKYSPRLSSRLGFGFGYKAPTVFTEESERVQYRNVLPISPSYNELEHSYGANWDVNYGTSFADSKVSLTINQLFFYTRISKPWLMQYGTGVYQFENISGYIDTRGIETNIKIRYSDLQLFLGYTLTDAAVHEDGVRQEALLTPKHRINMVLMYEKDEKWKAGLEGYYYSRQQLSDGTTSRDYWLCGFMLERLWKRFSLYINFENILDVRQTRFETIYNGGISSPVFRDIYAPLDGFVVNGGIKLSL